MPEFNKQYNVYEVSSVVQGRSRPGGYLGGNHSTDSSAGAWVGPKRVHDGRYLKITQTVDNPNGVGQIEVAPNYGMNENQVADPAVVGTFSVGDLIVVTNWQDDVTTSLPNQAANDVYYAFHGITVLDSGTVGSVSRGTEKDEVTLLGPCVEVTSEWIVVQISGIWNPIDSDGDFIPIANPEGSETGEGKNVYVRGNGGLSYDRNDLDKRTILVGVVINEGAILLTGPNCFGSRGDALLDFSFDVSTALGLGDADRATAEPAEKYFYNTATKDVHIGDHCLFLGWHPENIAGAGGTQVQSLNGFKLVVTEHPGAGGTNPNPKDTVGSYDASLGFTAEAGLSLDFSDVVKHSFSDTGVAEHTHSVRTPALIGTGANNELTIQASALALNANVGITGSMGVTQAVSFHSDASVGGALDVGGAATVASLSGADGEYLDVLTALEVTGYTHLRGYLAVDSTLSVLDEAYFSEPIRASALIIRSGSGQNITETLQVSDQALTDGQGNVTGYRGRVGSLTGPLELYSGSNPIELNTTNSGVAITGYLTTTDGVTVNGPMGVTGLFESTGDAMTTTGAIYLKRPPTEGSGGQQVVGLSLNAFPVMGNSQIVGYRGHIESNTAPLYLHSPSGVRCSDYVQSATFQISTNMGMSTVSGGYAGSDMLSLSSPGGVVVRLDADGGEGNHNKFRIRSGAGADNFTCSESGHVEAEFARFNHGLVVTGSSGHPDGKTSNVVIQQSRVVPDFTDSAQFGPYQDASTVDQGIEFFPKPDDDDTEGHPAWKVFTAATNLNFVSVDRGIGSGWNNQASGGNRNPVTGTSAYRHPSESIAAYARLRAYIEDTATGVGNGAVHIGFTGQHYSVPESEDLLDLENSEGLIVVATGRYNTMFLPDEVRSTPVVNASHPIVALSTEPLDKKSYGVISASQGETESLTQAVGCFVSIIDREENDRRLIINSVGEGGIWVCNVNGNLENGDYITTCNAPGIGAKQDDDLLHNYTVAKITMDCDFDLDSTIYRCEEFKIGNKKYKKAFVGCTYHCG